MPNHAFKPLQPGSNRCKSCGGWVDNPQHSRQLWSDVDREREDAKAAHEALEMAKQMRRPLGDVSEAAGIMERRSPLFYGKGSNPTLF